MMDATTNQRSKLARKFCKYGVDILNILFLGVVAFLIPGWIFDEMLPLYRDYPGISQDLYFTSTTGNSTFTSTVYILNPVNTRKYIENSAVSGTMLGFYDAVVPTIYIVLFVMIYFYWILKWNGKYLFYDVISYAYAYLVAMGMVFWLTRAVKFMCAWNRPDYWDRCVPQFTFTSTENSSEQIFDKCDYKSFHDYDDFSDYQKAYTSFVSGHTSYMFTAAIVLAYFTYGKLNHPYYTTEKLLYPKFDSTNKLASLIGAKWVPSRIGDKKNVERKYFYVFDLSLLAGFILATWGLWGSLWVAISRVDDHRHFPTDLIGGGILGLCCASFGYLTQYDYGQPFSKRVLRIMQADYNAYTKRRRIVSDSAAIIDPMASME